MKSLTVASILLCFGITAANASVSKETECLAKNIYYEAKGESLQGQTAVALVTLNRLRSKRWGKTICQVVYAKNQFSWTRSKKIKKPKGAAWLQALRVAKKVKRGAKMRGMQNVLYFHAKGKKPNWAHKLKVSLRLGNHVFYIG